MIVTMRMNGRAIVAGMLLVLALAAPASGVSAAASKPPSQATPSSPDSAVLKGGEAGTVFNEMTIEGEDRIRIEFARPDLDLDLDPRTAPGLDGDHALEVLDRNAPAAESPLLARSALDRSPRLARPWLRQFANGAVASFRPQVEGAVRWSLVVADSRGKAVASFQGDGKVPPEITWDGKLTSGDPALPGLTYSYVFEAYDRAGNKRSFLGDGFQIRPYVRKDRSTLNLLFTGRELGGESPGPAPSILCEAAGWLNQVGNLSSPVRIEVRAQGIDQARSLADRVAAGIAPELLGDPARLQTFTVAEPDAPDAGSILITAKL